MNSNSKATIFAKLNMPQDRKDDEFLVGTYPRLTIKGSPKSTWHDEQVRLLQKN